MATISIAIATYNRAGDLSRTLRGLEGIVFLDANAFEILVIDNRSTDGTRAVAEAFGSRFSGVFRYIYESRQGLSHARNRAVAEARHEVVAFLDDDVDVEAAWLLNLAKAYESGDYAAVGGRAELVYPTERPAWLGSRDEGYLTKVELGDERRRAAPDELYGVNLSVKKAWVERVGGFRGDLGRVGKCLIGSEETELLERVESAGGAILYEPSAFVGHRVAPERLNRRWFWSRSFWGHRGDIRILADDQASAYHFTRATWHIGLAGRDLATATIFNGPWGEEFFHQSRVFASRVGIWVGYVDRLARRLRPGLAVKTLEPRGDEVGSSRTAMIAEHVELCVQDTRR